MRRPARQNLFGLSNAAGAALVICTCIATGCSVAPIKGMAYVEPGSFVMGYDKGAKNEGPSKKVDVTKGFHIDVLEVSNQEYATFLKATKRTAPPHWSGGAPPQGQEKFPVVNITWAEAAAFAKHVGKRLPTEKEWEYAARGPKSNLYPWGPGWKEQACNNFETGNGGPVAVGHYGPGKGPFGTLDQAGNVWEWTATLAQPGSNLYIIKGGSFAPLEDKPRGSLRGTARATQRKENLGFRCVKNIK